MLKIPTKKKLKVENLVDAITNPLPRFLIQLIDPISSAEPNTDGRTVEKLREAKKAYSKFEKYSFPK